MKIEIKVSLLNAKNRRTSRWVIVAIDRQKDSAVDIAAVRDTFSAAVKERNRRAEWWSEQPGVETVISGPVPMGS